MNGSVEKKVSFDSRSSIMDENTRQEGAVTAYQRRDVQVESTPSYTSSLVVHLRQLQTDFRSQHQHEKHVLNELNEQLRQFVDRVQQLEALNNKYMVQIANARRSTSDVNIIDQEWSQRYLHLQNDLLAVSHGSIDFGLEVEMYQLQIAIYQQLIELEQGWKDDRRAKLEQEFNQTSLTLNSLRASNSELSKELESIYVTRDDAYQRYMRLTQEWSRMRKQSREWALGIQLLKTQVAFYKNAHSHSSKGYVSVTVDSVDTKQYWAAELEKVIKGIRYDFEQLYSVFYREMTNHYNTQLEELATELQHIAQYQSTEVETFTSSYQMLQIEYEKVHKTYIYEKDAIMKSEANYAKLESEYRALQEQNDERLNIQTTELENLQEHIVAVAFDVEETRRKKINLESEIIVYRHLLDVYGVRENTTHAPSPPVVPSTVTRKFTVKSQKKGSIGIRECPPDGIYISLLNHSSDKMIDISRWVLKRCTDGKSELRYVIPEGVRLPPATELRIYSKQGANIAKSFSSYRSGNSSRQELVNQDVASWGSGNTTETFLYNQNGEEKAVFSQSIAHASSDV